MEIAILTVVELQSLVAAKVLGCLSGGESEMRSELRDECHYILSFVRSHGCYFKWFING